MLKWPAFLKIIGARAGWTDEWMDGWMDEWMDG